MTDDAANLKPAKPVAPRSRLPTNPRMAQPMNPDAPAPASLEQEPDAPQAVEAPVEGVDTAPPAETFAPVQLVMERVEEPPPAAEPAAQPVVIEQPAGAPVPQSTSATPESAAAQPEFDFPKTIRDTLKRVDQAWTAFRSAALRFPSERMDERLSEDGWTRKQMLEHIAAWHDLTADRLVKMFNTGKSVPLEQETDAFNASVARRAVGKTSGEILKDMDATFNRLRRQLARASDAQLRADDWWLAYVIGGNTYGHYEEHWAEIYTPEQPTNARQRR